MPARCYLASKPSAVFVLVGLLGRAVLETNGVRALGAVQVAARSPSQGRETRWRTHYRGTANMTRSMCLNRTPNSITLHELVL